MRVDGASERIRRRFIDQFEYVLVVGIFVDIRRYYGPEDFLQDMSSSVTGFS